MGWSKKRDPQLPAEPAYHHPDRCLNCGHLKDEHGDEVGCLVDGGTKYIENETGEGRRVCTCEEFIPAPQEEEEKVDA